ncbi:helix-turn-helix domain-containing protein [Actinoplanes philippinensis]|uniref:helix-turn-helix domain-containing protein n=1 Tax=Actinoplanes philippinensis TaxID=35752 RepID=UPI0033F6889B
MRWERLEYLTAVIRHGSLRRAGERLHMSRWALSKAISAPKRAQAAVSVADLRPAAVTQRHPLHA